MWKDYLSVCGILLKNSFRKNDKDKKKKFYLYLAMIVGFLPLLIMISVGAYQITPQVIQSGIFMEFLVVIMTMAQLTIFFFGIFSILAYMFFSEDAEFLAALPVKKSSLFMSKLTMVYINELIVSSIILIPMLFITGISAINHGFPLNGAYFIFSILAIFIMPLIPLLLVSLLAFPMMYIVTFFKRRAVLSSVVTILLFIGFMAMYLGMVNGMASRDSSLVSGEQLYNLLIRFRDIAFFNTFYAKAMLFDNFFVNIGLFLLVIIASLAITILVSSSLYHKSVMAQLESVRENGGKGKIYSKQGIAKAFLIKDFKMLIRNPGFAFQSFMGPILTPIMVMFMAKSFQVPVEENGDMQMTAMMTIGFILFLTTMLLCGTNFVSSVAFTREGKYFYFNKYLPIPYKELIKGKVQFAIISGMVGTVLATLVVAFTVDISLINVLMFGSSLGLMNVGFVYMGIYRDLKKPKLDWNNVQEAVKQNFNAMVPMFFGSGIGILIMVFSMIIENLTGKGTFISWLLLWITVLIPSIVVYAYYKQKLDNNYVEMLNNIEV